MAAFKAILLRWTSRALKFCIPETLRGAAELRLERLFADPSLSVQDASGDLA